MGKWNLSFGHMKGTRSNPEPVLQQFETTGKGLLILLGNVAAAAAALYALLRSLGYRKK